MRRENKFTVTKHGTRRFARQSGVALLEVLISLLIFAFGVLGLLGLEAQVINTSVDSEDRNRAALFANEVASTMWLTGTVTPSAAQATIWNGSVADPTRGGLPNGTVNITPVPGSTNSANIIIRWQPPTRSGTALSTFSTLVVLP